MSERLVSILGCLWLAAGPVAAGAAPAATPAPAAQAAPSPAPAAVAASTPASAAQAAPSLDAQWGVRLLHALLIAEAAPDSPAARAGIRTGDILVGYGSTGVDDASSLAEFTAGMKDAARKGPVAAKIWRLQGETGSPREVTVELRLPPEPEARLGLAVHPTVFFREVRAGGAAAGAGVTPWDAIESVEGESLSERPRLSDFDARVTALRNREGNVRVTIGRWRPASTETGPPIALEGEREIALPVASASRPTPAPH